MRDLQKLNALQAFEAAARHGSFVAAATELHVTPAAVGQAVRALEEWLGRALFARRASGTERLVPLPHVRAALDDVSAGLDRLDLGLRRLREPAPHPVVSVTASQAIASRWLLPRLDDFAAKHPEIDIRLDVTDRPVDLAREGIDVGVRCGPGGWRSLLATRVMDEEVFPVGSPRLFAANRPPTSMKWLAKQTFLHDVTQAASGVFPSWSTWLARFEPALVPRASRGMTINATAAVLQAATRGQGIALARRALVHQAIHAGRLVRLFPTLSWPVAWGYFVVTTAHSLERHEVRAFRDWLVSSFEEVSRAAAVAPESGDGGRAG